MNEFRETLKLAAREVENGEFSSAISHYQRLYALNERLAKTLQIDKNINRLKKQALKDSSGLTNINGFTGFLNKVNDQINEFKAAHNCLEREEELVSVIVTAHNVDSYIEQCLQSLCGQTYTNIEVIVVDDHSNDKTADVIKRVQKTLGKVNYYKLNTNLGTYYAKNYGITKANGRVLFFQDGDDISHPERISLSMGLLLENDCKVIRGAYSRFDVDSNELIKVNGLESKLGLITLGVRKEVFSNIGMFNCTTKASDDEFFERFVSYYSKKELVDLPISLYYAAFRDDSLFADMVAERGCNGVIQKPSGPRQEYVKKFKKIHSSGERLKDIFYFPRLRDAISVGNSMTKLANPEYPVIFNVCSIPEREKIFAKTIKSIEGQYDHINVYLDRYKDIPSFLLELGQKCTVYRSKEYPNLRDNAKFLALTKYVEAGSTAYYFTIDDDILYPVDYAQCLIKAIENYGVNVMVGMHGVLLKDQPKGYFTDQRIVYSFTKALESPRLVNVLGTGTVAFRTDLIKKFDISEFFYSGMVDIFCSILARENNIPQVCIARHENWLTEMFLDNAPTLYSEYVHEDQKQSELLKRFEFWGYEAIKNTVKSVQNPENNKIFLDLLPKITLLQTAALAKN